MNKRLYAVALTLLATTSAFAGSGTITVLDSTSSIRTYDVITDGSGNFLSKIGICDQSAGATCVSVGTAGAPSTNALTVQALTLGHGVAANAMRVELPTDGNGVIATVSAVTAITNALPTGSNSIGSVTANAGTNLNTSALALETGGNLQTLAGTVTSARAAVNPISAQAGVQGGSGATTANTQRIAIATDANAVAATLQASATTAIGKVDPNTIATWGLMSGTVPGGAPSNTQIAGGIYNSAAPTPSTGQTLPFQLDASGNLNVNIKAGAGSGGTALQDNTAFTQGTTTATPASCLYATSVTNLTAGDAGVVRCTTDRLMLVAPGSAAASWGNWGIMTGTVPGAAPANTLVAGGIYNSSPPGPTTGQTFPFQLDSAGNLNVNIKAGAGSGGTALADGGTFTEATTSFTPVGGEYVSGGGANCTTGKGCTVQMTIDRMAYVNLGKMGGTAISSSCVSNYGTSPGAVACPSSNVFVTNSTTALPDNVDAVATTSSAANSPTNTYNYVFNGTTFDRMRSGTTTGSVLVNGAGTAGAASGGVMTVQGATSMTPVSVNVASGGIASGAFAVGSFLNATAGDPCMFQLKSSKNINTASGTTLLVSASGSTKVYVCSFSVVAPSAVSVSLSEGTGSSCNTANQAGVMGVAVNGTAANGMAFAANSGITYGNGGGTVAFTATAGNALCIFQSGTAQLAGNLMYVQQ